MVDINRGIAVFMRFLRSRAVASAALAIACTATVIVTSTASYEVTVKDGQSIYTIDAVSKNPDEVLSNAKISIGEFDNLDLSTFTGGDDSVITINRAKYVTVEADQKSTNLILYDGAVSDALKEADVTLGPDDSVTPALDTQITPDMRISVTRAFEVNVKLGGTVQSVSLLSGSVQDAIESLNISLGEHDEVIPSLDTPLKGGTLITVDRVSYEEKTQIVEIPYEVIEEKSDSLYKGEKKKSQDGSNGQKTLTFKEKYINGEMVDSTQVSEATDKEPVNETWLIGTKAKPTIPSTKAVETTIKQTTTAASTSKKVTTTKAKATSTTAKAANSVSNAKTSRTISSLTPPSWLQLDQNGAPTQYKQIIDGKATAYYAGEGGSLTSTGVRVRTGYVAVNPNQIPYGSKLYIVSHDGKYIYGYSIAADTGGFAKKGKITTDLYFNSSSECRNFGVRSVRIYVLEYGSGRNWAKS